MRKLVIACSLLLTACGGGGGSSSTPAAQQAPNQAPIANADTAETFVNTTVDIDVIGNDSDSNNDALTITTTSLPGSGTATINGGSVSYQPNDGYIGNDTFTYTISDGNGGTATANVSVEVKNKAPDAINDQVSTNQSQSVEIDLLANDSSKGGHTLSVVSTTNPSHGQIAVEGGQVSYLPELGYVGDDSFGYVVRDSLGDESTATVTISVVNIVPQAVADSVNTEQNQAVILDVLANDIDAEGDSLTLVGVSTVEHGSVEVQDNSISYVPNDGFVGIESFSYTLTDKYAATTEGQVTINIANISPTALDDQAVALESRAITIDVLANDSDVIGDDVSLVSVSEASNGIASIVDNKLVYQSNNDFEGSELIGYTIEDTHGAQASAFVEIDVNAGVFISGQVEGVNEAGIEVEVTAGSYQTTVTTEANGTYSAQVSLTQPEQLVSVKAKLTSKNITLTRYLDSTQNLLQLADSELNVSGQDISYLSTAEYELANLLAESNIETVSALALAQTDINVDYLLDLALAARLLVDNNSIILPTEYATINAFMQQPFALREQLASWRGTESSLYYQTANDIFQNVAQPLSSDLSQQLNIKLNGNNTLVLSNDTTGYFLHRGMEKHELTWQQVDGELTITFNAESDLDIGLANYCADGTKANSSADDFDVTSMRYKSLYQLGDTQVLIRQKIGQFASDSCFVAAEHTSDFDGVFLTEKHDVSMQAGEYYLPGIKAYSDEDIALGANDFHNISALFNFTDDGRFEEKIDQFITPRQGSWQIENGELVLNYDDGLITKYHQIDTYRSLPIWAVAAFASNSNAMLASYSSPIYQKQNNSYSVQPAMYAQVQLPLADSTLVNDWAIEFKSDNTGAQAYFDTEWQDFTTGQFTWSFGDNIYSASYYRNTVTSEYLTYCDVTDADCEKWRYREFEIIGQIGDYWLVKNYQQWQFSNNAPLKSGYIALFEQRPNR